MKLGKNMLKKIKFIVWFIFFVRGEKIYIIYWIKILGDFLCIFLFIVECKMFFKSCFIRWMCKNSIINIYIYVLIKLFL